MPIEHPRPDSSCLPCFLHGTKRPSSTISDTIVVELLSEREEQHRTIVMIECGRSNEDRHIILDEKQDQIERISASNMVSNQSIGTIMSSSSVVSLTDHEYEAGVGNWHSIIETRKHVLVIDITK